MCYAASDAQVKGFNTTRNASFAAITTNSRQATLTIATAPSIAS